MTQHIDLSLVGRVRGRGARRRRTAVYEGSGREGGIKYTLSVKSTLFWDFSMHTVLFRDRGVVLTSYGGVGEIVRLTSAVRCRGYR